MDEEIWLKVKDWDIYEVSNLGRILNSKTKLIKKMFVNNRGYLVVNFEFKNNKKVFLVHRIVAGEFCVKKEDENVVNHIDENQKNNCSSNLEWCTQKHNVNEAIKSGRWNPRESAIKRREKIMKNE